MVTKFKWGVATSAYQIEGATSVDGRGPSIWDVFSHKQRFASGDVATDHYYRFGQDIELMRELGMEHYRLSIAWPRLFPEGFGSLNQAGLDFYKRLMDALRAASIAPLVTLYHWDLPQALQEKGGWANRDTAFYFADYAETVFETFAGLVPEWITINEPWCISVLGHYTGEHAPGIKDAAIARRVAHHTLLGHGLAVERLRACDPAAQVGITLNLIPIEAASDRLQDQLIAGVVDVFMNRWFLDPIFQGRYPEELSFLSDDESFVQIGDLDIVKTPIDFLGVNYYFRNVVTFDSSSPLGYQSVTPEEPVTGMGKGWEVYPKALTQLLIRLKEEYGNPKIYITENGASYPDQLEDGAIHDPQRIAYLQEHINAMQGAIAQGVNVQGYYVWSLLDNFEWTHGYEQRFGLIYVDYATQKRFVKDSALFYSGLMAKKDG